MSIISILLLSCCVFQLTAFAVAVGPSGSRNLQTSTMYGQQQNEREIVPGGISGASQGYGKFRGLELCTKYRRLSEYAEYEILLSYYGSSEALIVSNFSPKVGFGDTDVLGLNQMAMRWKVEYVKDGMIMVLKLASGRGYLGTAVDPRHPESYRGYIVQNRDDAQEFNQLCSNDDRRFYQAAGAYDWWLGPPVSGDREFDSIYNEAGHYDIKYPLRFVYY